MRDKRSTQQIPSRLDRAVEGRILGGVCTGLGRATGIDPVVYRVAFAIMVLADGQGILLYVAAVLLMPSAPERPAVLENLFRRRFDAPGALTILAALLCAALAFSVVGSMFSVDAIAVLTVAGLAVMVAHARGVDLVAVARAFPERLHGYPPESAVAPDARTVFDVVPPRAGMVDLAALSERTPPPTGTISLDKPPPPASAPTPAPAGDAAVRCGWRWPPVTVAALAAAGVAAALAAPIADGAPGADSTVLGAAMALALVGGGLLLGARFRVGGLTTVGTVLTCVLLTSSVAAAAPNDMRFGDVEWRPTDTGEQHTYRIAAGSGRLDLTALPLRAGRRIAVDARVTVGELKITLPRSARVEVDARVSLGDLQIPGRTVGGPGATFNDVLLPEGEPVPDPPVIELRIRGRLADVDVNRG